MSLSPLIPLDRRLPPRNMLVRSAPKNSCLRCCVRSQQWVMRGEMFRLFGMPVMGTTVLIHPLSSSMEQPSKSSPRGNKSPAPKCPNFSAERVWLTCPSRWLRSELKHCETRQRKPPAQPSVMGSGLKDLLFHPCHSHVSVTNNSNRRAASNAQAGTSRAVKGLCSMV